MRSLVDDPHPEFTAAMLADLTGQDSGLPGLGSPVVAIDGGPATSVNTGASNALLRRRSAAMDDLGAMLGEELEAVTGSDNVFRDLGFVDPEAELAKSEARLAAGERPNVREVTLDQLEAEAEADAGIAAGDLSPSSWPTPDEIRKMAITQVATDYALARMAMAEAGPLPLVSSGPWEESDEESPRDRHYAGLNTAKQIRRAVAAAQSGDTN